MRIIVPMAGMGKRMRPHTLTTPKPLIPVAGKPIVQRLMEDIHKVCGQSIEEIAFIIGDFGAEAEQNLIKIAESLGAKGTIYHQHEALGTAHAIHCAKESLAGPVVVAFADTLFKADFILDQSKDGIIWVQQIEDPRQFGVVKVDANNIITDFVEKPEEFVSDLAIIGIYYFKDGKRLRTELEYLIDNNVIKSGEYQLPDALRRLTEAGVAFKPGTVDEWLDCGNKEVTVETNQRVLEHDQEAGRLQHLSSDIKDSVIIQPCYIGPNVQISNSNVGPHVSIGAGSVLNEVIVSNSIIGEKTQLSKALLSASMIGSNANFTGRSKDLSLGDFSTIHE